MDVIGDSIVNATHNWFGHFLPSSIEEDASKTVPCTGGVAEKTMTEKIKKKKRVNAEQK